MKSSGYKRSAPSADFINCVTSVLWYLPKVIIMVHASKLYKYASYEEYRDVFYWSKLHAIPFRHKDHADQSPVSPLPKFHILRVGHNYRCQLFTRASGTKYMVQHVILVILWVPRYHLQWPAESGLSIIQRSPKRFESFNATCELDNIKW